MDAARVVDAARARLRSARNADGGWAYKPGGRSRIESTCWASLALLEPAETAAILDAWPRDRRWLIDLRGAPVNYAFNALAAFTYTVAGAVDTAAAILEPIVSSKAKTSSNSTIVRQDNSIEAWGWVGNTASWVEPTAWCVLALKKRLAHAPLADAGKRVADGEALLVDRVCHNGGWNYGNKEVFGKALWPYVPTTALGLLALQDRKDDPVVRKSLSLLQTDVASERSVLALGLAIISLRAHAVPADTLEHELITRYVAGETSRASDILATAMLICALSDRWQHFTL